ncbi:MAG: DUF6542 domain-containing protein [Mycobacteriaceae bacterium]
MSTTQRARSGVPVDERSVLATVPGIPWWAAVAVGVGATFLGFVLDNLRGSQLTATFAFLYAAGCIIAILAVQQRSLFSAMVQPPLILFIAIPLSYKVLEGTSLTDRKNIIFTMGFPLIDRFPLMLWTTLMVLALGAARMYVRHQSRQLSTRSPQSRSRATRKTPTAGSGRPASRSYQESPYQESYTGEYTSLSQQGETARWEPRKR